MSGALLIESRQALQGLLRFVDQSEALRAATAVMGARGTDPEKCPYLARDPQVGEPTDVRLLQHCLIYTRAYAVLEYYVYQRLATLLAFLERNYRFDLVPRETKGALRRGTAAILTNLTKDRYKNFDEVGLVGNYSNAVSGNGFYKLVPEAILRNEQNYRLDEISRLFGLCGIPGVADWVAHHDEMSEFLDAATWESGTAASLLRHIIDYRNEAAHGSVSEISSPALLREAVRFIDLLIAILHDRVQLCLLERMMKLRMLTRSATVIESYKGGAVVADWAGAGVHVGDGIVSERDGRLRLIKVLNLQLDDVDIKYVRSSGNFELGLLLGERVKEEKPLYVFRDDVDTSVL